MDIKQLITLKTLSVEKNYLKASDKLSYAPSTLSKHIRTLEDELQVQLVEFRNNKIELTENGMKFMKYAEKILDEYYLIQREFVDKDNGNTTVNIAGGELMVGFAFGDFFAQLESRGNSFITRVHSTCCARVPSWLDEGRVDMGFVEVMSLADNPGYDTVPLFREKLCVMTVSDHPLVGKSNVTMSDFENCGFAFTYEDCCFTAQFRKELEAQGVNIASELLLGSIFAVISAVKKDRRICLVPYVCVPMMEGMGLVKLDWADDFDIYDVILTAKSTQPRANIDAVINGAKDYARKLKSSKATEKIVLI